MKARHNSKERAGLHFIAHTIEDKFNWAFREQSIADVGIDAIVEACTDGNPTGNFLAMQIKSGEGNVTEKKDAFTYYISNTHYFYWINIDMPIILTCYIKKYKKKIYWVELNRKNIKKTKTRWKIDIPKSQILNAHSQDELLNIITGFKNRILTPKLKESRSPSQNLGKILAIKQLSISLKHLCTYVKNLGDETVKYTADINEATQSGNQSQLEISLYRVRHELQYTLSNYATRTHTETQIFSKLFSDTIIGFMSKYELLLTKEDKEMNKMKGDELSDLNNLIPAFEKASGQISSMRTAMNRYKNLTQFVDIEHTNLAILATDQIISEINVAQNLINDVNVALE